MHLLAMSYTNLILMQFAFQIDKELSKESEWFVFVWLGF